MFVAVSAANTKVHPGGANVTFAAQPPNIAHYKHWPHLSASGTEIKGIARWRMKAKKFCGITCTWGSIRGVEREGEKRSMKLFLSAHVTRGYMLRDSCV